MITLRFFNLAPPASEEQIQGREFLFDAGEVLRLPGRNLVARYRHNAWLANGQTFLRAEIRQAVACTFRHADDSELSLGVFSHVAAVDGVLILDGKAIALLKHQQWSELAGSGAWRLLHVAPPR